MNEIEQKEKEKKAQERAERRMSKRMASKENTVPEAGEDQEEIKMPKMVQSRAKSREETTRKKKQIETHINKSTIVSGNTTQKQSGTVEIPAAETSQQKSGARLNSVGLERPSQLQFLVDENNTGTYNNSTTNAAQIEVPDTALLKSEGSQEGNSNNLVLSSFQNRDNKRTSVLKVKQGLQVKVGSKDLESLDKTNNNVRGSTVKSQGT